MVTSSLKSILNSSHTWDLALKAPIARYLLHSNYLLGNRFMMVYSKLKTLSTYPQCSFSVSPSWCTSGCPKCNLSPALRTCVPVVLWDVEGGTICRCTEHFSRGLFHGLGISAHQPPEHEERWRFVGDRLFHWGEEEWYQTPPRLPPLLSWHCKRKKIGSYKANQLYFNINFFVLNWKVLSPLRF